MAKSRVVLDGPSNLGLRPPVPGAVPGCYKLAGAIRDQGFLPRIGAADAGYVTPPRYDREGWKPGDGVFNAEEIAAYTVKLADRLTTLFDEERFVVLLGGECSILLGPALALKRRGRYGVVYLDGHSDFRTVDNSPHVGAAGGEALALITGRGQADLTDLEQLGPYTRDTDAALLGIRADDEYVGDVEVAGIPVWPARHDRRGSRSGRERRTRAPGRARRVLGAPRRRHPRREHHAGGRQPRPGRHRSRPARRTAATVARGADLPGDRHRHLRPRPGPGRQVRRRTHRHPGGGP